MRQLLELDQAIKQSFEQATGLDRVFDYEMNLQRVLERDRDWGGPTR